MKTRVNGTPHPHRLLTLRFVFAGLLLLTAGGMAVLAAETDDVVAPDPDARNVRPVAPRVISEPVSHDSDDPAIWVNRADPAASLVIGTDKDADGALFVFGLDGKVQWERTVRGLLRPNNVDVAYDVALAGQRVDVVVTTERYAHRLRVYRLPDMAPIDGGGIPVFEGEVARDAMGIALYTRPTDGALFAVVSRSDEGSPPQGYLHQYALVDDGTGTMHGHLVRRFGTWSGRKEIEAIAVDGPAGFIYYSDEHFGVRKYQADPLADDADEELGQLGMTGFAEDREGISIYPSGERTGYILVSNQQADTFRIFRREGHPDAPHQHDFVASVRVSTRESDGNDVVAHASLPGFPGGLFVAMSSDQTYHFYAWDDIASAAGLDERR